MGTVEFGSGRITVMLFDVALVSKSIGDKTSANKTCKSKSLKKTHVFLVKQIRCYDLSEAEAALGCQSMTN